MRGDRSTFGLVLCLVATVSSAPAFASAAAGTSELKLTVSYAGNPILLRKGSIKPGQATIDGYGGHEERFGEETLFPTDTWTLDIFADAFAWSPPDSMSHASYTAATGSILELYSDPDFIDHDETVHITAAASVFLSAFAYPNGWAKASSSYSINAFGSDEDAPSFSLFPPFPFSITYPPVTTFIYDTEITRTIVISPGQHYYVNLRDATVTAIAYVPEPNSWALLVIGFGLAGWRLRRPASVRSAIRI